MSKGDPIISKIGEFGAWQAKVIAVVSLAGVLSAWQTLVSIFQVPEVGFQCVATDTLNISNYPSFEAAVSEDQCTLLIDNNATGIYDEERVVPCTEWTFNSTDSLVAEFSLVCDRDILRSIAQSVYMAGLMVGALLSGILSDMFGRKKTLLLFSSLLLLFGSCLAATNSIEAFIVVRFLTAMSNIATFTCNYVYCMEIIGGKWTTIIGIGLEYPWAIGYLILPGIAKGLPYWSHMQLAISVPVAAYVILLLIPGLVPESPRWLLLNNRREEANKILREAAKMNGLKWIEEEKEVPTKPAEKEESSNFKLTSLMGYSHSLVCTVVMWYLWFTNSFVYYGLTLNSGSLFPGDIYVNSAVAGALEILAYFLTTLVFLFCGRRYTMSITMFLAGACLLFTLLAGFYESTEGVAVLAQIGKFAITGGFAMVYQYAAEIFPTVLRNSGMGSSSLFARKGAIVAPYIGRELTKVFRDGPVVIFGLTSLLAGILSLVLPETKNKTLPDTLEEGEQFLRENAGIFRRCLNSKNDVKSDRENRSHSGRPNGSYNHEA